MKRILSLGIVLLLAILCAAGLAAELPEPENGPGTDIGYYEIRSDVNGAKVFLDDKLMGSISQGVIIIPVYSDGKPYRSYSVQKTGYSNWTEQIFQLPKSGQTIIYHAILKAKPVVSPGMITVASTPPGPEIFLDGVSMGIVPASGVRLFDSVPSGSHLIRLSLAGYQDYSGEVFVPAGGTAQIRVAMDPVIVPTTGTGSFTSTPSGATVAVDGMNRGLTPVVLTDLPPGNHVAVFSLTGFQDFTTSFVVTAGSMSSVSASLVPVTTKPSPTRASGAAGIIALIALGLSGFTRMRRRK